MRILNTILSILFPAKCLACGKTGAELCLACLADAPAAERESAEWIFPLYDYRDPMVKKALWLLKYKNRRRLANVFAEVLHGQILEELSELSVLQNFREPLLIPIPLSGKRQKERGYNQAELICRELIWLDQEKNQEKNFRLEKDILIKPKETEHQARIENRSKRLKNIRGAFAVKDAERLRNKNIILIDDITTTGATLSEARKTLKRAGAKKVIAFTVAH